MSKKSNSVQILVGRHLAEEMEAVYDEYAERMGEFAPGLKGKKRIQDKLDYVIITGYIQMRQENEKARKNETPGAAVEVAKSQISLSEHYDTPAGGSAGASR